MASFAYFASFAGRRQWSSVALSGVRAVQCLEGKTAWEAARAGKWDRELLDAALSKVPTKGPGKVEDEDAEALVYLIEYRDGLQAAAYMSPKHVREFAFAGRVKKQADGQRRIETPQLSVRYRA